mmetsp:Transcript_42851/g.69488  ORF Transcript_42851/g.69488 Transcript_42851/m.69488 type:complete len:449 (+) Transcript_42851:240-1586(+)
MEYIPARGEARPRMISELATVFCVRNNGPHHPIAFGAVMQGYNGVGANKENSRPQPATKSLKRPYPCDAVSFAKRPHLPSSTILPSMAAATTLVSSVSLVPCAPVGLVNIVFADVAPSLDTCCPTVLRGDISFFPPTLRPPMSIVSQPPPAEGVYVRNGGSLCPSTLFQLEAQQLRLSFSSALSQIDMAADIASYLLRAQRASVVPADYLQLQTSITPCMRAVLVDWLVDVHREFGLVTETLYSSVCLLDRFLSKNQVERRRLQLVGITAMFSACKYEEHDPPKLAEYVDICDYCYTKAEIRDMERLMLQSVDFYVGVPTALDFLRLCMLASHLNDIEVYYLARYLLELSLQDCVFLQFCPSVAACSALCLALAASNRPQVPLLHPLQELRPCMEYLRIAVRNSPMRCAKDDRDKHPYGGVLRAIYDKYSQTSVCQVARTAAATLGLP